MGVLSLGEPFMAAKFSQSYWEMGMGPCCLRMSARALCAHTHNTYAHANTRTSTHMRTHRGTHTHAKINDMLELND